MGILRPSLTQTHNGVGGQRAHHPDTRQMVVNPTINVQKVLRVLWRREKFFLAGVGWKRLHQSSNGDPPKETKDPALAQEADSEPLAQTLYRTYSAPVGKRQ